MTKPYKEPQCRKSCFDNSTQTEFHCQLSVTHRGIPHLGLPGRLDKLAVRHLMQKITAIASERQEDTDVPA